MAARIRRDGFIKFEGFFAGFALNRGGLSGLSATVKPIMPSCSLRTSNWVLDSHFHYGIFGIFAKCKFASKTAICLAIPVTEQMAKLFILRHR